MNTDFPAFKLGVLAVRQFSKYIADYFKLKAKNNPIFGKYICIPPAQLYNKLEVKTKLWTMNIRQPKEVKPLSEAAAIDLGVNLLGELVLFVTAAAAVAFEVSRQMRNENRKLEKQKKEMSDLVSNIQVTERIVEEQDAYIKEMEKVLSSMGKSVKVGKPKEPFKSKLLRPFIDLKSKGIQTTITTKTQSTQTGLIKKTGWLW